MIIQGRPGGGLVLSDLGSMGGLVIFFPPPTSYRFVFDLFSLVLRGLDFHFNLFGVVFKIGVLEFRRVCRGFSIHLCAFIRSGHHADYAKILGKRFNPGYNRGHNIYVGRIVFKYPSRSGL